MRYLALICFVFLLSCKDEQKVDSSLPVTEFAENKTKLEKPLSVDTIRFSEGNYVLAKLLSKSYSKDNICDANFELEFNFQKEPKTKTKLQVKGFDEGSEWYGNFVLDSIYSPLKEISLGYPACGYTHNHYLFHQNKKQQSLIHEWFSMGDGGWSEGGEIVGGNQQHIIFRNEAFLPDDDATNSENEEWGINEFSDSIHLDLENGKWIKKQITPKGKVYRSVKKTFEEYHK